MRNTVALILFVFLFLSCSMRQEANITGMCEKDSMSADGIVRCILKFYYYLCTR